MLKKVSIGILIFIGALLITAFFIPRGYTVTNSETIAAPPDSVLHFMCMLGNQTRYNEWVMQDPDLTRRSPARMALKARYNPGTVKLPAQEIRPSHRLPQTRW